MSNRVGSASATLQTPRGVSTISLAQPFHPEKRVFSEHVLELLFSSSPLSRNLSLPIAMEGVMFGAPLRWVLRFLTLLSICSLVLGKDCYFRNGTAAKYHVECKDSSGNGQGLCCVPGTSCIENGLCRMNSAYYRGACSDVNWGNPNCPAFCNGPEQAGKNVWVQRCINKQSDKGDIWGCLDAMIGIGDGRYECSSDQEIFTVKSERSSLIPKAMTDLRKGDYTAYDRIPDLGTKTMTTSEAPSTAALDAGSHMPIGGTTTSVKGVPHSILSPTKHQTSTKTPIEPLPSTKAPPTSSSPPRPPPPPPPPPKTTEKHPEPTIVSPPPKPTESYQDPTTIPSSAPQPKVTDDTPPAVPTPGTPTTFIPAIANPPSTAQNNPVPTTDVLPTPTPYLAEDNKSSIPIGVGTAFGSAILVSGGLLAFFYIRKRRRERLVRAETPPPVTETSYYEPEMGARMRDPLGRWRMRF